MKAINESQLWKKRLGDWVLNPYIGCEHGCYHCYCPAMPGVRVFNGGRGQRDWGKYLLPKPNFAAVLREQLRTFTPDKAKLTDWGNGWVLMSFLTDCYTPAEATHKITRDCLRLLLEAGHKVRVQTRSVLVERDFDILAAHSERVLLGTSLPYLDDPLARALEPRAAAPSRRLRMLQNARERGIRVYAALAPFMPFHGPEVLDAAVAAVNPLKPAELFCEVLNPKGDNRAMMAEALAGAYRALSAQITAYGQPEWARFTHTILSHGHAKHGSAFIPWPDTQRQWERHLTAAQGAFLSRFLPPPQ